MTIQSHIPYALLFLTLILAYGCSTVEDCGGACGDGTICDTETGQCVLNDCNGSCGPGTVCDSTTGQCVLEDEDSTTSDPTCTVDSDCNDATLRCSDGACVEKCDGVVCLEPGEVCNASTGFCVGGSGCTADDECDEGFTCVDSECRGGPFADCSVVSCQETLNCISSDFGDFCFEACTTTDECPLNQTCIQENGTFRDIYANHCLFNNCRPGGDQIGFVQDSEYGGACDANGTLDGWCVGPFPGADGDPVGVCVGVDGARQPGESCDITAGHDSPDACDGGLCFEETLTCRETCSLFDDTLCQEGSVCIPIWTEHGACFPTEPVELAPIGEGCGPNPGARRCVEGAGCGPRGFQDGAENICMAYCLTDRTSGSPGSCDQGVCTGYTQDNPTIGVCLVD